MPIEKKKGESKEEYIGRCIGIEVGNGYDPSQAAAICYDKWENMANEILESIKDVRKFKVWNGNTRTRNNPLRLKSSNVWKWKYDDIKEELTIKFQEGDIYTYNNISMSLFLNVVEGDAKCLTSGKNRFGEWDINKTPSIGAAVYKYLVEGGVSYKKGGYID